MEIATLGNAQPCSFPKNAQFLRALVVVGIFGPFYMPRQMMSCLRYWIGCPRARENRLKGETAAVAKPLDDR
jgi:hypothetical protein